MMLVEILANQIDNYWPLIQKLYIEVDPFPEAITKRDFLHLYQSLIAGRSTFWIVLDQEQNATIAMITSLATDGIIGKKKFLVYAIGSLTKKTISEAQWLEGFSQLQAVAKAKGAEYITGYSTSSRLQWLIRETGGFEMSYYEIPVKEANHG